DRNYLYYVGVVFSIAMLIATINGYTFRYLWPEATNWNKQAIIVFFGLCCLVCRLFHPSFPAALEIFPLDEQPLEPNQKLSEALNRPVNSKLVNPANARSGILGDPVAELMDDLNISSKRYHDSYISALSILLLEVETSRYDLERNDVLSLMLLPRRNGTFNVASRYKKNAIGPSHWCSTIDGLCRNGFLELISKGFKGKEFMSGLSSSYRPTSKIYDWMDENRDALEIGMLKDGVERVVLKSETPGGGKKLKDYEDDDYTTGQRDALNDLSTLLKEQEIRVSVGSESLLLPPQDFEYQRIFNDDFQSGGRLYCSAQQMKSSERGLLCFNGRKTSECDFRSHQPRLIYHLNDLAAPADCYDNPWVSRDLMKKAMTRVMNCSTEKAAIATLSNLLVEVSSDEQGTNSEDLTPKKLLSAVYETHPILKTYRSSTLWKQLQFIESNLAFDIMLALRRRGVACLGVHDSFVVEEKYLNLLTDIMNERYHQRLGFLPELKVV
ncbi:hypothetical protein CF392_03710, partial [Tamilnaduibacter salinus]